MSSGRTLLFVVCWLAIWGSGPSSGQTKPDEKPAVRDPGVKTVIIVRHAEAGDTHRGGDNALTPDGRTRAKELARVLGDNQLRSIYITHYQRNRQTAELVPRAAAGEKPTVIDDVPATIKAVQGEPWGTTSLIVGHSNTVPDLVRGLAGQALPAEEPIVFDRMWVVTIARDGTASLLRLRYGAPVAVAKKS